MKEVSSLPIESTRRHVRWYYLTKALAGLRTEPFLCGKIRATRSVTLVIGPRGLYVGLRDLHIGLSSLYITIRSYLNGHSESHREAALWHGLVRSRPILLNLLKKVILLALYTTIVIRSTCSRWSMAARTFTHTNPSIKLASIRAKGSGSRVKSSTSRAVRHESLVCE